LSLWPARSSSEAAAKLLKGASQAAVQFCGFQLASKQANVFMMQKA